MNRRVFRVIEDKRWNRDILNVYWCFVAIITLLEVVTIFFAKRDLSSYIIRNVITPSVQLLIIMTISEIIYRYFPRLVSPVQIVIVGSLLIAVVIYAHADVDGAMTAFFLPLLVAVSYFDKKLLVFTSLINTLSFIVLYLTNESIHSRILPYDFVAVIGLITLGAFLCYTLLNRSFKIIENLERIGQDRDDLLVENAIKDQQTKVDMLTGLYNQHTFHLYLQDLVGQNKSFGIPFYLALFDIDNFKSINDTFGHLAGDEVLKKTASTFKEYVDPNDYVFRFGGDEFAIIFVDKTKDQVEEILNKVVKRISNCSLSSLGDYEITISCGIQQYKSDWTKEELFSRADKLLYSAKESGKNQIKIA